MERKHIDDQDFERRARRVLQSQHGVDGHHLADVQSARLSLCRRVVLAYRRGDPDDDGERISAARYEQELDRLERFERQAIEYRQGDASERALRSRRGRKMLRHMEKCERCRSCCGVSFEGFTADPGSGGSASPARSPSE